MIYDLWNDMFRIEEDASFKLFKWFMTYEMTRGVYSKLELAIRIKETYEMTRGVYSKLELAIWIKEDASLKTI